MARPLSPGAFVDKVLQARASVEKDAEAAAEKARRRVLDRLGSKQQALLERVPEEQRKQAQAMLEAAERAGTEFPGSESTD